MWIDETTTIEHRQSALKTNRVFAVATVRKRRKHAGRKADSLARLVVYEAPRWQILQGQQVTDCSVAVSHVLQGCLWK